MIAFGVDPGIDDTGVAVFDVERTQAEGLKGLYLSDTIQTDAKTPLPLRLAHIAITFGDLLELHEPAYVFMEMPAYAGDYGGKKRRRQDLNKLYMAIGALVGITGHYGVDVVELEADHMRKDLRHEQLKVMAIAAGIELPTGARGGKRDDEWDAIWTGFFGCTNLKMLVEWER